jgi:hypothetical protein
MPCATPADGAAAADHPSAPARSEIAKETRRTIRRFDETGRAPGVWRERPGRIMARAAKRRVAAAKRSYYLSSKLVMKLAHFCLVLSFFFNPFHKIVRSTAKELPIKNPLPIALRNS